MKSLILITTVLLMMSIGEDRVNQNSPSDAATEVSFSTNQIAFDIPPQDLTQPIAIDNLEKPLFESLINSYDENSINSNDPLCEAICNEALQACINACISNNPGSLLCRAICIEAYQGCINACDK